MESRKKVLIFAVFAASTSLCAVKITYEGAKELAAPVTVQMWKGLQGLQFPQVKSLRNPFKTFTVQPGQKTIISIPQGPYWVQAIGKDGKKISGVIGISPKGRNVRYAITVEKNSGILGLGATVSFRAKGSDLVLKEEQELFEKKTGEAQAK